MADKPEANILEITLPHLKSFTKEAFLAEVSNHFEKLEAAHNGGKEFHIVSTKHMVTTGAGS